MSISSKAMNTPLADHSLQRSEYKEVNGYLGALKVTKSVYLGLGSLSAAGMTAYTVATRGLSTTGIGVPIAGTLISIALAVAAVKTAISEKKESTAPTQPQIPVVSQEPPASLSSAPFIEQSISPTSAVVSITPSKGLEPWMNMGHCYREFLIQQISSNKSGNMTICGVDVKWRGVGCGLSGSAYALQINQEEEFCIKISNPMTPSTIETIKSLIRHPISGIVPVFHFETVSIGKKEFHITTMDRMEYDFDDHIYSLPLQKQIHFGLLYIKSLCNTCNELEKRQTFHTDFLNGNIMFSKNGVPTLIDLDSLETFHPNRVGTKDYREAMGQSCYVLLRKFTEILEISNRNISTEKKEKLDLLSNSISGIEKKLIKNQYEGNPFDFLLRELQTIPEKLLNIDP